VRTVWSNVKNPTGRKGRCGKDARFPRLAPGERTVLAELDGPGVIDMLWLTLNWPVKDPFPESMLRNQSIIIECFWEDAEIPAVSAPIGDFFGHILGYDRSFENAFFDDPSGRSFRTFIPMPFRKRARIELFNGFHEPVNVFHDVRMRQGVEILPEDGYLHAYWQRCIPGDVGRDNEILPLVTGEGRYLGTHLGLMSDPANPLEWHCQTIKFFLDGDADTPTLMTATLDDYCGSSWDYDLCYTHQDGGLLFSRRFESGHGHHGLYCYHRRDPVYFHASCRVAMRFGCDVHVGYLVGLVRKDPTLLDRLRLPGSFEEVEARAQANGKGLIHCDRSDDLSSAAFYFLNTPEGKHRRADQCAAWRAPGWCWPQVAGCTANEPGDSMPSRQVKGDAT
jgi:hypothetical protein